MQVRTDAFPPNGPIPKKYTGEGDDVSPPFFLSGVPAGAKSLAILCDDPDAPRAEPWVHWVVYNIPPTVDHIYEAVEPTEYPKRLDGAVQGVNDFGKVGYGGPMPPVGHGVHHYHFRFMALDRVLPYRPHLKKNDLLREVKGHILAECTYTGTYKR